MYADGEVPDGMKRKRRRKPNNDKAGTEQSSEDFVMERRRECPVPKPGGLVGQVLGFGKQEGRLPEVRIETASDRRRRAEKGPEQ